MAYEVNGSVYFDVLEYSKSNNYGILSKRNLEDLIHNTRSLEGQSDKKNPQDFALWKKAEPKHIMKWNSPWGDGFPGWHIECTAMSNKYLGDIFDIHGGGIDLKFPHHECEIAQSNVCFGTNAANYWVHANMLTLKGQKMSKSTDNNILPEESFYKKYYQPDNAVLVIAGKFDEEKAKNLIIGEFGAIPAPDRTGSNRIYPTYTQDPSQDGERTVTLRRLGDTQFVMASYHIPPGSHEEFPAIDIMNHALSAPPSGRLHRSLVETGLAANVAASAPQ